MTAWDPDDLAADDVAEATAYSDGDTDDDSDDDYDGDDDYDADDDDDDELDDADDDEIDFCVALYREDGEPTGIALEPDLANDFEALIDFLKRIPGDGGALGLVSLDSDVLVAVRVRGPRHIQVFVSDAYYSDTWPLVRDAVDYLDEDPDSPDMSDEGPVGDLGMFADLGLSEMDLEAIFMEADDLTSEDIAERIAAGARFAQVFHKAVDDYWDLDEDD
jgi:putative tRNA adenosine deaminase-associated protein